MGKVKKTQDSIKNILYGNHKSSSSPPPPPPVRRGIKRIHNNMSPRGAPFATSYDLDPSHSQPSNYNKKLKNDKVKEKIGTTGDFDPKIYKENYKAYIQNNKMSALRNFRGSGNIISHKIKEKPKTEQKDLNTINEKKSKEENDILSSPVQNKEEN